MNSITQFLKTKRAFFLGLYLLGFTLKGQVTYFHYLDHSVQYQWYSSGTNFVTMFTTTANFHVSKDTLINGNWFYRYDVAISFTNALGYAPGTVFIREDTAHKFYQFSPSIGQEDMTYDWKKYKALKVGDTIPLNNCTVTAIDSVQIGTSYRKRWHGAVSSTSKAYIIEGIGYTGDVCALTMNAVAFMTCYKKQNNHLAVVPNYTNCKYVTPVNLRNKTRHSEQVRVFPNPAGAQLSVESKGKNRFLLWDGLGRLIFEKEFDTETTFSVAEFQRGIYLYQLVNEDGSVRNGKVVLE